MISAGQCHLPYGVINVIKHGWLEKPPEMEVEMGKWGLSN
jgi:hypothetical protein